MKCGNCFNENDQDAVFCVNCGNALSVEQTASVKNRKKSYWYGLLMLAAVLIVSAIGYYKFFLPAGVAAVVNGEEIALSEVEGMVNSAGGRNAPEDMRTRMRYAILSDLITERIAWQEAKKAGLTISSSEVDDAYNRAQMSSGSDREAFHKLVSSQFGSEELFRAALERRALIRKYIADRLAAGAADPAIVDNRTNRWLQEAVSRSTVRIALAEQAPASGCGCCNNGPGAGRNGQANGAGQSIQAQQARRAALAYWAKQHGDGAVDAKLTDFGCHIQVDIIKEKTIAKSLRYQNGAITEM